MEHASVADLSVLAVAHLALHLKTGLGQIDGEGACGAGRDPEQRRHLGGCLFTVLTVLTVFPAAGRPPLASLTAFCRYRSEPSEDERLPVDAGHFTLQARSPKVSGKTCRAEGENKASGRYLDPNLIHCVAAPFSPRRRRQLNHAHPPSPDWPLIFPCHAHCPSEA